jgi:poly-gamma-glutamate capsule biosynthesis protein CapA/YwtB (metallophosphatase superfamily)
MLGRGVAQRLADRDPASLVAPEVVALAREADLFVLNLECCISERGERWPAVGKPFFFRAPPQATELLVELGVGCVTLANNHALDFGPDALLDTFEHLAAAGIPWAGAGAAADEARAPTVVAAGDLSVGVVSFSDHPADYAAELEKPGIAWVDLERGGVPSWLVETLESLESDVALTLPHWGPNMCDRPQRYVRDAAAALRGAGASLIAGHSAHVVQGVEGCVLYDLGGFLDDYRVDPALRNDLGLLFVVDVDAGGPRRLEAIPLKLEYCFTRLAAGDDGAWIRRRFRELCAELGTEVEELDGRLVVEFPRNVSGDARSASAGRA